MSEIEDIVAIGLDTTESDKAIADSFNVPIEHVTGLRKVVAEKDAEIARLRAALERAAEIAVVNADYYDASAMQEDLEDWEVFRQRESARAVRRVATAIRALIPPAQRGLGSAAANQLSGSRVGEPEAPVREGWKPIETAPKDRAILVYDTGQGRCIAYWTQWHDNLLSEDREGWRTMGDWERLDWVTHWMAIPGPPPPRDQREG